MPKAKIAPTFGNKKKPNKNKSNNIAPFEIKENVRADLLSVVRNNPEITELDLKVVINKHLKNMSESTRKKRFTMCVELLDDVRSTIKRDIRLERKRTYYRNNRETVLSKARDYYKKNKDAILSYKKEYYEKNRQRIAEYKKMYYAKNADRLKLQSKEYNERRRVTEKQEQINNNKKNNSNTTKQNKVTKQNTVTTHIKNKKQNSKQK